MRLQCTMFVWKILLIGLAGVLGGCSLPAASRPTGAADTALALAQTRWQAHHPARYRLVVQEETDDRSCRQAVEVREERVEAVLEDHCGRATAWTISGLLDWISYRGPASAASSIASQLALCQVHQSERAVYDPKLGYPYSATYQWALAPNWTYLRPLQQLLGARLAPNCTVAGGRADGAITIRVISLTVLP